MNSKMKKQLVLMSSLLGVLLLALALGMWLNRRSESKAAAAVPRLLAMPEVNEITLQNGTERSTFVREDDAWYWQEDRTFPLDASTVEALAELADDFTAEQSFEAAEAPEVYGLAEPQKSAVFSDGTDSVTVFVGDETSAGTWYAKADGSDRLYTIGETLPNALEQILCDMAEPAEFPPLSTDIIQNLTIFGENTTEINIRQVEEEYHWFLGENDVDADSLVTVLRTEIASVSFEALEAWKPTDLAAYGLDQPAAVLTVHYTMDEMPQIVTLTIGGECENGYYCTVDTQPDGVYSIAGDSVKYLLSTAQNGFETASVLKAAES